VHRWKIALTWKQITLLIFGPVGNRIIVLYICPVWFCFPILNIYSVRKKLYLWAISVALCKNLEEWSSLSYTCIALLPAWWTCFAHQCMFLVTFNVNHFKWKNRICCTTSPAWVNRCPEAAFSDLAFLTALARAYSWCLFLRIHKPNAKILCFLKFVLSTGNMQTWLAR